MYFPRLGMLQGQVGECESSLAMRARIKQPLRRSTLISNVPASKRPEQPELYIAASSCTHGMHTPGTA
jgi:hypothetical protein